MKILIISFYFEPDLSAGSFRSTALAHALIEQLPNNAHVEVITTVPNRYDSFTTEAPEFENRYKLIINRINITSHNSGMIGQAFAFIIFASGVIRLSKGKDYDLVFATSSRLMTAVLGAYISKKINKRLYLDIRDIFVDTIKEVLPKKMGWFFKPVFSLFELWAIQRAYKIILVSEGFLPYFQVRYPKKTFGIFTNGIDSEFIKNQPKDRFETKSEVLNVIYAGNFGEGQGLHKIIPRLARRYPSRLRFKLIGDGGRKLELVSAVNSAGCNNVEILPPVKRNELIKIYQNADILFLHLNEYEAFKKVLPSKLFEYGALGKPIWAGVSGHAADFIIKNIPNAVVFPPCNVDEAFKSFESLEIVTQPRDTFIKMFSRSSIMHKMAVDIISAAREN